MNTFPLLESETILEDDYPVFWDYSYIADMKIIRSDIQGTVFDLKQDLNAKEIRRCDIFGREGARLGDALFFPNSQDK
jgi:hypothetical protein